MATRAPKVRDDLEYFEQEIDGDDMVLVRDPVRNTYFRFNVLQAAMLRALDGHRTAPEISAVLAEQYEVEIPPVAAERFVAKARDLMLLDLMSYASTSPRARRYIRKALRKAGFHGGAPAGAEPQSWEGWHLAAAFRELEREHPRAAAAHLAEILDVDPENARAKELAALVQTAYLRAAGATTDFPTWVLFNPVRMLAWLSRTIGGFLFGWMGILAMLAFVCVGAQAYTLVSFEHVSFGALDIAIAVVTITVSSLFHELGHGLACQHYGGNVTEIGITFFYYVRPLPYCDTSSSYMIKERRYKMIIHLAGMIASLLFIAAHAIFLALVQPTIPIYSGLAIALVLTTGVLLLNVIPFLKIDGYYALSDYFDFPNLRDRSFKLARAWLVRRLLGLEAPMEEFPRRTRGYLIVYAILSFAFTGIFLYLVLFQLLAPIVERFRGPGLLFAAVLVAYLLRNVMLRPIGRGALAIIRQRRRIFTHRRSAVLLAIAAALVAPWFVRWPVLVDAEFVVVPQQRASVRAQVAGRVETIAVREGDRVRRGDAIARLRNPALRARIAVLEAERAAAVHDLERCRRGARPEALALARRRVEAARAEVQRTAQEATMAHRLAAAALGTQSIADTAETRAAVATGVAGATDWALSLLRAGARREDIAIAEAELARIDAELAKLRNDEALLVLRAPIDGVIATPRLDDKLQAALAPGDAFAEVHDLDAVVAEIALAPSDPLAELATGDAIALRAYGAPDGALTARVSRVRDAAEDAHDGGARRVVVVTSPFALDRAVSGLRGHARIYGAEHSLAYAYLYLPLQRLVRVRLWSMW